VRMRDDGERAPRLNLFQKIHRDANNTTELRRDKPGNKSEVSCFCWSSAFGRFRDRLNAELQSLLECGLIPIHDKQGDTLPRQIESYAGLALLHTNRFRRRELRELAGLFELCVLRGVQRGR